jgi:hypothetical protein
MRTCYVFVFYVAFMYTARKHTVQCTLYGSRIHERTVSLRFLEIIFRVLRLEDSVFNFYITNQVKTTFLSGGGGGDKILSRGDCE